MEAGSGGRRRFQPFRRRDFRCRTGRGQNGIADEAAKAGELLKQLPGDQQHVLKLSIYEGLSHSSISEATGLSLGTVKTHIRRGLIKLREALFQANNNLPDPHLARGEVKS